MPKKTRKQWLRKYHWLKQEKEKQGKYVILPYYLNAEINDWLFYLRNLNRSM